MNVDNLFIVESPLQALVALELSLQFPGKSNGIIYRLSGKGRERNDEQICKVVERGEWIFSRPITFNSSGGLAYHLSARKFILSLRREFSGRVHNLFFGEFRSQWMHASRLAISPERYILMDDGAATIIAKKRYIDKGVYYPVDFWKSAGRLKYFFKSFIYRRLFEKKQVEKPLAFASAFFKDESEFVVDFSSLREKFATSELKNKSNQREVYFFGSKYSESGILSRAYELYFISQVKNYYARKGLKLVYCSHRDESGEKLNAINRLGDVHVVSPDLPAELFILDRHENVAEIAAAYSSVINNLSLIFPDKPVTSFRLSPCEVNPVNRVAIEFVYQSYEEKGILVERI